MTPVVIFDVNETLLDVAALDPLFDRMFGDPSLRREWFGQMLQSAFVATITDSYRDFGVIGVSALEMVAARHGVTVSEQDRVALGAGMRELPPHPEVRGAMERLREAGFRLATLTNSTLATSKAQLANAGLDDLLERMLSADAVQRLKPAAEPYLMAADELDVPPASLCLVAAHAWDIAGALHAGLSAAFVARRGQVLDPASDQPGIVAPDLQGVAERLIAATA